MIIYNSKNNLNFSTIATILSVGRTPVSASSSTGVLL